MEKIAGTWEGAIQIPNTPLSITVIFSKKEGTISIPVQGIDRYPLSAVSFSEPNLSFAMDIQGQQITFEGKAENDQITGMFKQMGQSFPFELKKASAEESKQIGDSVQVDVIGGTMEGLLTMPEGAWPFPVMIIIAGSGPTDRDGNSAVLPGKNNSLKMLAEDLAANGIASIRYDKRGVGQNISLGGKEAELTFDQFINDAVTWVQFAKADQRFSKVGIIGHSEGSLIGMAAAGETNSDAFISIAGAGRPIDQVLLEQLKPQLPESLYQESEEILEKLKQGKQGTTVSAELQSLFRLSVQPYMISWLRFNPQELLKKLNCPVMILNGNHDLQVSVTDAKLLHSAKPSTALKIIDGMNHVLKEAPEDRAGNMAAYSNPDLPLASGLVDEIVTFLK